MTLQEIEARIREAIPDALAVTVSETLVSLAGREPSRHWSAGVWFGNDGFPAIAEVRGDPDSLIQAVRLAFATWAMSPQEE